MYAVIKTGGKQYRVRPGDMVVVEKLAGEAGAEVSFDQVLMVGEGDAVTVGAPLVEGALVKATLVETRKGEKVKIFKKIRRQGYRRTRGHRQFESVLRVTSVAGAGHRGDAQHALELAMAAGAAIALAADLLEDLHLLALAGLHQGGLDQGAFHQGRAHGDRIALADHQHLVEGDFRTGFTGELLDHHHVARADPVLLSAGLDHRVHRHRP